LTKSRRPRGAGRGEVAGVKWESYGDETAKEKKRRILKKSREAAVWDANEKGGRGRALEKG